MTSTAAARCENLDALHGQIWGELVSAAQDRAHAWRRVVLATHDAQHGPDARTIVLRECDRARQELVCYTDTRSPKVVQLRADARATLVLWSQALGWQLRLRCRLSVETDGLRVTTRWAALRLRPAAQDYLSPLAPGSVLDAPEPPPADEHPRQHFGLLVARVQAIDWLELHAQGHRRAVFDEHGARWVMP